ncbi:MAG: hypothetical protein J6O55_08100, partial [Lachnospiraceae bacterium]|nr:hypothetical protein [Lachnospiraceae bacterium]
FLFDGEINISIRLLKFVQIHSIMPSIRVLYHIPLYNAIPNIQIIDKKFPLSTRASSLSMDYSTSELRGNKLMSPKGIFLLNFFENMP